MEKTRLSNKGQVVITDALHLASSMKADKFVTFDNALIKKVRKLVSIDITLS
jgi:predicted nucleic acid-binding protein